MSALKSGQESGVNLGAVLVKAKCIQTHAEVHSRTMRQAGVYHSSNRPMAAAFAIVACHSIMHISTLRADIASIQGYETCPSLTHFTQQLQQAAGC